MSNLRSIVFEEIKLPLDNSNIHLYKDLWGTIHYRRIDIEDESRLWEDDVNLLRSIKSHENMSRFFACHSCDDISARLVTEFYHGNLEDYVQDQLICKIDNDPPNFVSRVRTHKCFQEAANSNGFPLSLTLVKQTTQGLKHLHDQGIIHCDIRPSNVLLCSSLQQKPFAKLGGFQFCKKLTVGSSTKCNRLDPTPEEEIVMNLYMAKECQEDKPSWSKASDIFALGILIYYTLTLGGHPFCKSNSNPNLSVDEVIANIKGNQSFLQFDEKIPKFFAENKEQEITALEMIKHMTDHEKERRLSADEVLFYPTFYSPQRKLDFLLKVYQSLKKFWGEGKSNPLCAKILEVLKNPEYKKKLQLSVILQKHKYFLEPLTQHQDRSRNTWQIYTAKSGGDLKVFLKFLRDKITHACDVDVPEKFREGFGVKPPFDSYDPAKFLDVFVSKPLPRILVDLYECYRHHNKEIDQNEKYASTFYP